MKSQYEIMHVNYITEYAVKSKTVWVDMVVDYLIVYYN